MNIDEKLRLIKRNTQEIISKEELKKLLEEKEKPIVYLGTSVTGRPHIGYFTWAQKLNDFLNAGFKVKVLLADLHGALDNTPWPLLEKRFQYYSEVITGMIDSLGGNLDNFEIIKGSDFQLSKDYVLDLYKMSSEVTIRNAEKASSDVVKQGDNPKISGLIYPLMQALDEVYLDADVQLGAVDQRKIFVLAREFLPKIGYKQRVEVMIPFIRGLTPDGKMSSSNKASKIDLLDDFDTIKQKLKKAYCEEGNIENGVLDFARLLIMTQKQDKNEEFIIDRPEKFGGPLRFKTQDELKEAFASKQLHPMDLKQGVLEEVDKLLEPIRKRFIGKEQLIKDAYPDE
jgi:tyrosyl-tRNA synthetase